MLKLCSIIFILYFFSCTVTAQNDDLIIKKDSKKVKGVVFDQGIDPLSPSRAAFYSAVFPGGGQIYNKKYWKVPIVWVAIGSGVYAYNWNQTRLNRYKSAYKLELAGKPHEFDGTNGAKITSDGLTRAQEFYKKNRDLSIFITIGLYALNILEANVDAHLPDKALDTNLSLKPTLMMSPVTNQAVGGLTLNYNF